MQLPISASTFGKSFLDGKGKLDIETEQDAWGALFKADEPFDSTVADVAKLNVGLAAEAAELKLGQGKGLQLSVSGSGALAGSIHLVRSKDDPLLATQELRDLLAKDRLYAVLELVGTAQGSAKASYVPGPLTATFGLAAGGDVVYRRYKLHAADTSAREVLRTLFRGVRLPQAVDAATEIPEKGELLSFRHGGYLALTAGVQWGYSLSGLRSFELGKLDLDLAFEAKVGAHLGLGYKLAGDFAIEATEGHDAGWVRLTVRKSRNSQFDFAADIGVDANVELKGLPADPNAFLGALLGTDVQSFVALLDQATQFTDPEKLRAKLDALAWTFLQERAQAWMDKALDDETSGEFFEIAQKVVAAHRGLEPRVATLLESFFDRIPALRRGLQTLAELTRGEDLATLDKPATRDKLPWEIVNALAGERIHDLLLDEQVFDDFRRQVERVLELVEEGAEAPVVGLIQAIKEDYHLDLLFRRLGALENAAALRTLADEKLKGVVERLVGKTFDGILAGGVGDALKQVNALLSRLEAFKKAWYERLQDNVAQSFSASVAYAFTRASGEERLLDLEINLNREEGARLVHKAAGGDFAAALAVYDPALVLVRRGLFTHHLEKAASLRVNVYGWGYSSLTRVVQDFEHAVESDPTGLVHVYALDTLIQQKKEKGKRFKESIDSTFLLAAVGEAVQRVNSPVPVDPKTGAFLVENLRKLSVQYDLVQRDEDTSVAELTEYLGLGESLGLFPSAQSVAEQLARDFPEGLGEVTARYVVRYDEAGVLAAFTLGNGEQEEEGNQLALKARNACRRLLAAHYIGRGVRSQEAQVGLAYLDPALAEVYKKGFTVLTKEPRHVLLPAWFTGSQPRKERLGGEQLQLLGALYATENQLVERLDDLDRLVDRCLAGKVPIPVTELQKAARRFVESAKEINKRGGPNAFFGVFDALVLAGSSGKGRRESALVLETTPPGGEKVKRIFIR